MRGIKDISIRYKIILIIMIIFFFSFGVTFMIFIYSTKHKLEKDLEADGLLLARLTSDYTSAPLFFGIKEETEEILSRLSRIENVNYCVIYDNTNALFAAFNPNGFFLDERIENPINQVFRLKNGDLICIQQVEYQDSVYGFLKLNLSSEKVTENLKKLGIISLLIIFIMLLVVYLLAFTFQKIITEPILYLAKVTMKISGRHDLSIRLKKKSHDEIGILYDRFNIMLEQLQGRDIERNENESKLTKAKEKAEESDKLKTAFLANMSHEIRTPMNSIVGFAGLLTDDELNKHEREEYVGLINNSCTTLLHLIDDILDISKIEAGQMTVMPTTINIKDLFNELFLSFKEINQKENHGKVEMIMDKPQSLHNLQLHTDIIRLRQIIGNLLNNAIKFTDQGQITFGCNQIEVIKGKSKSQFVKIFVCDTGVGIEDEIRIKIFDRFTKIEPDNNKLYRGAGLGLTISKKLVELLGGEIWVESARHKGSCFYFTIPIIESGKNVERIEDNTKEIMNTKDKFSQLDQKKILIVEDEQSNYELLKAMMRKTNADIYWAQNGKEAIALCDEYRFDIVLMDIKMSVMNGYEATKILREKGFTFPIIAQTAYARLEDEANILKNGFDGYISKPIDRKRLFDFLNKHLGIQ